MTVSDNLIPACPPPDPNPHMAGFAVPPGACDGHFHIFGPADRYPYSPGRGYTPPDASIEQAFALHEVLGIERGVLTQPSVYGTDNSLLMAALSGREDRLKAVVAVNKNITDREIAAFDERGARGARVNIVDKGGMPFADMAEVRDFTARLAEFGWHLEVLIHISDVEDIDDLLGGLSCDVVVGHLGFMDASLGVDHGRFRAFLDLVKAGGIWVKLTGTYRISDLPETPYDDVTPFAKSLIDARPDRLIWGSDWPHPKFYKTMPNDGYLLDQIKHWTYDPAIWQQVLVDNPAELYGFQN